jgi:hypothetical protein
MSLKKSIRGGIVSGIMSTSNVHLYRLFLSLFYLFFNALALNMPEDSIDGCRELIVKYEEKIKKVVGGVLGE